MPIEIDNIIINKAAIIERSLKRMRQEYAANPELTDFTHIDAMILNIERACQAAIDLAFHIVAVNHYGVPQTSADSFIFLFQNNILREATSKAMIGMTGFRNVAIHQYQDLNMDVLRQIAEKEYETLISLCQELGIKIVVE
ncbi:MAG: DUF86 domain-containing protein [Spirochaetales bacterium]|nr:DUF86 domain-containing protein [Spirochaetales bacterium]